MKYIIELFMLAIILNPVFTVGQNIPITLDVNKEKFDPDNDSLESASGPEKTYIGELFLFGAGSLLSGDSEDETNPISGEIGFIYRNNNLNELSMSFQINDNETIEPVGEGFGNALLIPGNGSNSFNLQYIRFSDFKSKIKLGWGAGGFITNTTWKPGDEQKEQGVIIQPRLFLTHRNRLTLDSDQLNAVIYSISFGYTARIIGGNLSQDETLLENAIGTNKTYFHGIEANFRFGFKNVYLKSDISFIAKKSDIKINGFTGIQASIGVAVTADVLTFKVVGR